jgi:hypothetical protein
MVRRKTILLGFCLNFFSRASLFSFQRHTPSHQPEMVDIEASNSTLRSYTGIDRRQAMMLMARRIADSKSHWIITGHLHRE